MMPHTMLETPRIKGAWPWWMCRAANFAWLKIWDLRTPPDTRRMMSGTMLSSTFGIAGDSNEALRKHKHQTAATIRAKSPLQKVGREFDWLVCLLYRQRSSSPSNTKQL